MGKVGRVVNRDGRREREKRSRGGEGCEAVRLTWRPGSTQPSGQVEALEMLRREFSGRPLHDVRVALASRWAAIDAGSRLAEPDLTRVAVLISGGKRFRLEPDGRLVIED